MYSITLCSVPPRMRQSALWRGKDILYFQMCSRIFANNYINIFPPPQYRGCSGGRCRGKREAVPSLRKEPPRADWDAKVHRHGGRSSVSLLQYLFASQYIHTLRNIFQCITHINARAHHASLYVIDINYGGQVLFQFHLSDGLAIVVEASVLVHHHHEMAVIGHGICVLSQCLEPDYLALIAVQAIAQFAIGHGFGSHCGGSLPDAFYVGILGVCDIEDIVQHDGSIRL